MKRYADVVQATRAKAAAFVGFMRATHRVENRRTPDDETQDTQTDLSAKGSALTSVDIDDDTAAEIIRRALPALERARELGKEE